jgi:hypothetical protein
MAADGVRRDVLAAVHGYVVRTELVLHEQRGEVPIVVRGEHTADVWVRLDVRDVGRHEDVVAWRGRDVDDLAVTSEAEDGRA